MSRMLIAMVLSASAICGLALQAVEDTRPTLIVFTGPGPNGGPCSPCVDFHTELTGRDRRLYSTLQRDFHAVVERDVRDPSSDAKRYNITRWPTFVAVDATGRELKRVVGFNGGYALWQDLTRVERQLPVAPVTRSKLDPPPPKDATEDPQDATEALPPARSRPDSLGQSDITEKPRDITDLNPQKPSEMECVDGVCRILKPDLDAATARSEACEAEIVRLQKRLQSSESLSADQIEALKRESLELRGQLERLSEDARRADAQPLAVDRSTAAGKSDATSRYSSSPDAETSDAVLRDAGSRSGPGAGWAEVGAWVAKTAIGLAAPEAAIPLSVGLTAVGWLWNRARKKKQRDDDPTQNGMTRRADTQPLAEKEPDEFKIENLPLQHIDYTSCWAEHWRNSHADPATALRELELYVQAWQAVNDGHLALPGFDNAKAVFASINKWVNRQVTDHAQKALTSENTNHRVFYAHTWKTATDYLREGTFRAWKPNPQAADTIDDWVAEKLTEKLTAPIIK